jgi:endonuclease G, mitochondrial
MRNKFLPLVLIVLFFGFTSPYQKNKLLPSSNNDIVQHLAYTLSYNNEYKQADWVFYELKKEMIGKHLPKPSFKEDPLVKTGTAVPDDFSYSGYDRGHLCPAADMEWSQESMEESFYMSNISPQVHSFNAGIWERIENFERESAVRDGDLYIVTGGVLKPGLSLIGQKNEIAVPKYFYKVIVDLNGPEIRGIGFLVQNEPSNESIDNYVVTIDSIEKFTGINFFALLPDSIQYLLEKSVDPSKWDLSGKVQYASNYKIVANNNGKEHHLSGKLLIIIFIVLALTIWVFYLLKIKK